MPRYTPSTATLLLTGSAPLLVLLQLLVLVDGGKVGGRGNDHVNNGWCIMHHQDHHEVP